MTNSFFADDAYQPQMVDHWDLNSDYAPTPGQFGRTPATLYSPSPGPNCATDQLQFDHLNFPPLAQWEEGGEYDELPPRYICYTISWKLIVKSLQANVENMLQTKKKRHQRIRSEGTAAMVKVDERSQKKHGKVL
ncbi:unnamed protein product [Penicillium pancosmium]